MAQILDGTAIASGIRQTLAAEVQTLQQEFPGFMPGVAMLQVGDDASSSKYVEQVQRYATEVGTSIRHVKLPRNSTKDQIFQEVNRLNDDDGVHGILVLHPLDTEQAGVDFNVVVNMIKPEKDVEGLGYVNAGMLSVGAALDEFIVPCTPKGCLKLIEHTGIELTGKKAVVLGRNATGGVPMADLLIWKAVTVTLCDLYTVNLMEEVKQADILVSCLHQPQIVQGDWIKPGAVVIDGGLNYESGGSGPVGDVDFDAARQVASWITPTPGGVGPMIVAMLLSNTVDLAKRAVRAMGDIQE